MKEKNYMSNQIHQVGHLLLNPFSEKNKQKKPIKNGINRNRSNDMI